MAYHRYPVPMQHPYAGSQETPEAVAIWVALGLVLLIVGSLFYAPTNSRTAADDPAVERSIPAIPMP